jgi:hypothetical protein
VGGVEGKWWARLTMLNIFFKTTRNKSWGRYPAKRTKIAAKNI